MEAVLGIFVACLVVAGVAFCIAKPRYAIVPVIMLFPVEQIVMGYLPELRGQYSSLINIVVGLIAVFGVTHHFLKGEGLFKGYKTKVFALLLSFYVYCVISIIWSPSPDGAVYFLSAGWPYFVLLYLVSPLLVRSLDDMVSVNLPMIVVGIAVMALMLVNPHARFFNGRFTIDMSYGVGTQTGNPLAVADAGSMLAIICALYRPNSKTALFMVLRVTGMLLGLTLALLSGSRGQTLAGIAVIAALLPFAAGTQGVVRKVTSLIVVGIAVGFLYFVFQTFLGSLGQTRWTTEGSLEGLDTRLGMIFAALEAYFTRPGYWLTGLGASAFNAYYEFRDASSPYWYPHNIAVEAITEYGVPGMLLLGSLMWITFRNCIRLVKLSGQDRSRRSTAIVLLGIVAFNFLMGLKQGALLGIPPLFMFCLIIARVTKNEQEATAVTEDESAALNTDTEGDDPDSVDEWAAGPEAA